MHVRVGVELVGVTSSQDIVNPFLAWRGLRMMLVGVQTKEDIIDSRIHVLMCRAANRICRLKRRGVENDFLNVIIVVATVVRNCKLGGSFLDFCCHSHWRKVGRERGGKGGKGGKPTLVEGLEPAMA